MVLRKPHAFTLLEMLVAVSIFMAVVIIVSGLYVSAFRTDRKTSFEQQVLEDARFLLKKIAAEIRENTVDYEEYYNRLVLNGNYGANYGAYRALFYNPGLGPNGENPGDLGMHCNDAPAFTKWAPGNTCVILRRTEDHDTGQNPYLGTGCATSTASAFHNTCPVSLRELPGGGQSPNLQSELYLISPDGRTKKIFVREITGRVSREDPATDVAAVSMAEMTGSDTNNDEIPDTFACRTGYICTGPSNTPNPNDVSYKNTIEDDKDHHQDFVPISALRADITSIQFYISPLENPLLAYNEDDPAIQHVPYVTMFLTVKPNRALLGSSVEDFTLTLQETVSTELLSPVPAPVLGQ